MSLCLIDVHGDIEGDFEWVEDLPKNRGEFLIAIAELEQIKNEIQGLIDFEESCCGNTTLGYECLGVIDNKISELKGDNK